MLTAGRIRAAGMLALCYAVSRRRLSFVAPRARTVLRRCTVESHRVMVAGSAA